MLYLDTALIVAALTSEAATDRAQTWFQNRGRDVLVVSAWVATEFAAAIAVKVRVGELSETLRDEAESGYRALQDSLVQLEIVSPHYARAAQLARVHRAGLRAGDALHLAIALASNATLCTLDKRFARACEHFAAPFELV